MLNTSPAHIPGKVHQMPVVVLKTRKGMSIEQKRRVVKEFTSTLVSVTGVQPELVTIMIDEHELENIGKAGKLRCD
jgi:4-oxalocrotonate tautomerase family enzyme